MNVYATIAGKQVLVIDAAAKSHRWPLGRPRSKGVTCLVCGCTLWRGQSERGRFFTSHRVSDQDRCNRLIAKVIGSRSIGLSKEHGVGASADIGQRVPVAAADAQEVKPVAIYIGCDGAEHDAQAAVPASPHGDASIGGCDRSLFAKATGSQP